MFLYTVIEAIVGIILGIALATRTKKSPDITYGVLDNIGRFTNFILLIAYICFAPMYMFIGMICSPAEEGALGIVGWIISIVCASASFFCSLGLGSSVALRKSGKSAQSFAVQFLGVIAIGLTVALYTVFVGNLLSPLN